MYKDGPALEVWREKHPEHFKEWAHRNNTSERYRAYHREYQKRPDVKYKEKSREICRAYFKKHPEETKFFCEACGHDNVKPHHPDYTEPLNVIWLCPACHKAWHHAMI